MCFTAQSNRNQERCGYVRKMVMGSGGRNVRAGGGGGGGNGGKGVRRAHLLELE